MPPSQTSGGSCPSAPPRFRRHCCWMLLGIAYCVQCMLLFIGTELKYIYLFLVIYSVGISLLCECGLLLCVANPVTIVDNKSFRDMMTCMDPKFKMPGKLNIYKLNEYFCHHCMWLSLCHVVSRFRIASFMMKLTVGMNGQCLGILSPS